MYREPKDIQEEREDPTDDVEEEAKRLFRVYDIAEEIRSKESMRYIAYSYVKL